jgi:hypothetical protein
MVIPSVDDSAAGSGYYQPVNLLHVS